MIRGARSDRPEHRAPLGGLSLNNGSRTRIGWIIACMVAIGGVLVMVLRPDPTPNTINLVPLHDRLLALRCLLAGCPAASQAARFLFFETLGNVLVFVPIGLTVAGALHGLSGSRRVWIAIAAGAALSIGIELVQLAVPSRATDVDDVLLNTLGAALGAILIVRSRH